MDELSIASLARLDPQRLRCWHIPVGGEAEKPFPAGDDLFEEEAERLRLRQVGHLGLVVILDVDQRIVNAETLRQPSATIQAILDRLGLRQPALRLPGQDLRWSSLSSSEKSNR